MTETFPMDTTSLDPEAEHGNHDVHADQQPQNELPAGHQHDHPPISRAWKRFTLIGNAVVGAAELALGNTSRLSLAADGLHNAADVGTYAIQADAILNHEQSPRRRARLRKLAYWVITATSLGAAVKAGGDMCSGHEHEASGWSVAVAGASVALNGAMFGRLRHQSGRLRGASAEVRDLARHFYLVDLPSAGLALTGSALQHVSPKLEQVAAIACGAVGAISFRPTRKNMSHNCLAHEHGHEEHHRHTRTGVEVPANSLRERTRSAGTQLGTRLMLAQWDAAEWLQRTCMRTDATGQRRLRRDRMFAAAGLGAAAGMGYLWYRLGLAGSDQLPAPPVVPSGRLADQLPLTEGMTPPAPKLPAYVELPVYNQQTGAGTVYEATLSRADALGHGAAPGSVKLEFVRATLMANGLTEAAARSLQPGASIRMLTPAELDFVHFVSAR